ncbi:MAG: transglutaminase-like domain-containing protein [Clostridia bacterium]|nr:transglutaminase-like domain-containing protein [Clostridia bacterium]
MLLCGNDWTMEKAVSLLKEALPVADRIMLDESALRRVAAHALRVRESTPWGAKVPGDIFAAYVLVPRVNNEDPQFYHAVIWRQLERRVAGMDMARAALEVNRWCYEQATYQSTDGRTANALTVMRRGFGRCGEESVLLVSALRACGIPARQLYSPWWSHCDDNHAWVEVWIDGVWHYMGACEPEPVLDSGWFTAAASKALLIHTRAFGVAPEGERVECRVGSTSVINRTRYYAKTRLLNVQVVENGAPKPCARVRFEVANMAGWQLLCAKTTDIRGEASLEAGLGTLRVRVDSGDRVVARMVDLNLESTCLIDFGRASSFMAGEGEFAQRPPLESRIQPAVTDPATQAAHARFLAEAAQARQARFPTTGTHLIDAARGNREVVGNFLADQRYDGGDTRALLESLREKDLCDVTPAVLEDAMEGALPFKDRYPREIWAEGVLCPRVANEMLYPVRRRLAGALRDCADPGAVWDALRKRVNLIQMEPEGLVPDLPALLEFGWSSEALRDVLFVAACRALGFAARLSPLSGAKEIWTEGGWRTLLPEEAETAALWLENAAGQTLTAGVHFSVAVQRRGLWQTLGLYGTPLEDVLELRVAPGRYRVMTASRQIDGSVLGRERYFELAEGQTRTCRLALPPDDTANRLLYATLPPLNACRDNVPVTLPLPTDGRPAIAALLAPGEEPTEHFLNELLEAREALTRRGVALWLMARSRVELANDKLQAVLRAFPSAIALHSPDEKALLQWRERVNARELRLPLAVAVGQDGTALFAFVNYNVGSVTTLLKIIDAEGARTHE